jgi:hypothetical protein
MRVPAATARCCGSSKQQKHLLLHLWLLCRYHDEEWGQPEHDDNKLFELLILEGAQVRRSTPCPNQQISMGSRVAMQPPLAATCCIADRVFS